MKQLTLDAFLTYKACSDLTASPDNTKASFVTKIANAAQDGYDTVRYISDGKTVTPLLEPSDERAVIWDDANTMLVATPKEDPIGATDFYRVNVTTGEKTPAFTLPIAALTLRKISEGNYFLNAWIDVTNPDAYQLEGAARVAVQEAAKAEADYQVLDEIPFWTNSDGYTNHKRHAAFAYCEATGTLSRISNPLCDCILSAAKDGKVYFCGETRKSHQKERHEIYCYDPATKESTCIYDGAEYCMHAFAATDSRLILIGSTQERYGFNENPCFYQVDENGVTLIADPDLSIWQAVGSDCRLGACHLTCAQGDDLMFISTVENTISLYKIGADNAVSLVYQGDGTVDDMCVVGDELLMIGMFDYTLQEIYAYAPATKEIKCISAFNTAAVADTYIAKPKHYTLTLEEKPIHGWVLLPKDYDETKTYPSILDIHGGPKMAFGPIYMHEMQAWANLGYFVYFCNPIGSDGFGNDYVDMRGKYGDIDYRSVMHFTDFVLSEFPQIDPARMAVTGGSYGGFMTNWIIGHTDRFACAASQRSISNWITHTLTSDLGPTFSSDQTAATIFTSPETLWKHSPLAYAGNVTTPTLFIHAAEDYRCPLDEGVQMYAALQLRDIPSRMCIFYGETHELSRNGMPKHRLRRLTEITNWIETYTKAK